MTVRNLYRSNNRLLNIFSDYKYSESGIYVCPETENCNTIDTYKKCIDQLPLTEELETFGMDKNANIAYQV